jgi:thiol-disulfide isomerase/thioredoxin
VRNKLLFVLGMAGILISCSTRPPSEKKIESKPLASAAGAICETMPTSGASAVAEPAVAPAPAKRDTAEAKTETEAPATARADSAKPDKSQSAAAKPAVGVERPMSLPRMWDFGSEKCIPCKTMMGILTPMMSEYAGKVDIRIINVYEEQALASQYRIQIIPTQVFLDTTGRELWRHIGVLTRDSILLRFKEYGFTK